MSEVARCPGCASKIASFPALSRYGYGDICSTCGTREAFSGDFITLRIISHPIINSLPTYNANKKHRKSSKNRTANRRRHI